jgi:hypothetical protein
MFIARMARPKNRKMARKAEMKFIVVGFVGSQNNCRKSKLPRMGAFVLAGAKVVTL